MGDVDGEEFVFEVGGAGVGGQLGADQLGPACGDLRHLGMGIEFHSLEGCGDEIAQGHGVAVGRGRLEVGDMEALAGNLPLIFVVAPAAVHRGAL